MIEFMTTYWWISLIGIFIFYGGTAFFSLKKFKNGVLYLQNDFIKTDSNDLDKNFNFNFLFNGIAPIIICSLISSFFTVTFIVGIIIKIIEIIKG